MQDMLELHQLLVTEGITYVFIKGLGVTNL